MVELRSTSATAGLTALNIDQTGQPISILAFGINFSTSAGMNIPWIGIVDIERVSFRLKFFLEDSNQLIEDGDILKRVRFDVVPILHLLSGVDEDKTFTVCVETRDIPSLSGSTILTVGCMRETAASAWSMIHEAQLSRQDKRPKEEQRHVFPHS